MRQSLRMLARRWVAVLPRGVKSGLASGDADDGQGLSRKVSENGIGFEGAIFNLRGGLGIGWTEWQ
jgi:hypothetical protein